MARGRKLKRRSYQSDPPRSVEKKMVSGPQSDGISSEKEDPLLKRKAEETALDNEQDATFLTDVVASEETGKDTPRDKERRRRNRFKGSKSLASSFGENEEDRVKERGKQTEQNFVKEKNDLAGLISMCSNETKKDCFKYRVFGFPEAKKDMVEKVKKGTKLFLFDVDKRILYGVYKATSAGGMNLVEEAFKNSSRKFPAQVRFQIHKDCMPLEESEFKQAIRANYFQGSKFKCELNDEQVRKLLRLFRPLDSRGLPTPKPRKEVKRESIYKSNPSWGNVRALMEVESPARNAPLLHRREQLNPREYVYAREDFLGPSSYTGEDVHVPLAHSRDDFICLPSPPYGRENIPVPSLPYARKDVRLPPSSYVREDVRMPSLSYARQDVRMPSSSYAREDSRVPLSYAREDSRLPLSSYAREDVRAPEMRMEAEALALYRERLQLRQLQDAHLESLGRRASYASDPDVSLSRRRYVEDNAYTTQQALMIPRLPLIQDQHLYRDIDYQREISSRGYGDGVRGISGAVAYDPAPGFLHHRSYGI